MRLLLLIILLSIANSSLAQSLLWEHAPMNTYGLGPLVRSNEGNLVVGGKEGPTSMNSYTYVASYALNGSLQWQAPRGRKVVIVMASIVQLPNNKYWVGDQFLSAPSTFSTFLRKLDANGDTATGPNINFIVQNELNYIVSLHTQPAGELTVLGQRNPNTSPFSYYTFRKVDSTGNTLQYKEFAKSKSTNGPVGIPNRRGNYTLYGLISRPAATQLHPFLMEITPNGDSLLGKKVVVFDSLRCTNIHFKQNNIIEAANGDFIFTGMIKDCNGQNNHGFVARVDSAFNLLWGYEHVHQPQATSFSTGKVAELEDGSFLFMGHDNPMQPNGYSLIRVSASGQFISQTYLLAPACPNSTMQPLDWVFLPDSSLVICGRCRETNRGYIGRWGNLSLPTIQLPTVYAGSNDSVCAGATPFALTGFSPAGGVWSGPGVSAVGVFTPTSVGTHTLTYTLIVSGHTVTANKTVTVHALPTPGFNYTLTGNQAVFSNISTGAATYSWSFGDGNTSTEVNPSHTFSSSGSHIVTLAATSAEGCTGTTTQTVLLTGMADPIIISRGGLGQSYPNPTADLATIPYTLPMGVENARIEIREVVTGRLVSSFVLPVREGAAELQVGLSLLPSGTYAYTLLVNGSPDSTKKMVIIK